MKEKDSTMLNRFSGKGVFPHQLAFTLLIPMRNIFLSPRKLIQRLGLKETDQVLEVGPGPGYFSVQVARVLTKGSLTLSDIQEEMLAHAQKRIIGKGLNNVAYNLCDGTAFSFDDDQFDVIYMVTVLGEVANKEQYVKEFYRILKPGGLLSISEQGGDPDKMSIEEIKGLLYGSGFELDHLYGKETNFTIHFSKRP